MFFNSDLTSHVEQFSNLIEMKQSFTCWDDQKNYYYYSKFVISLLPIIQSCNISNEKFRANSKPTFFNKINFLIVRVNTKNNKQICHNRNNIRVFLLLRIKKNIQEKFNALFIQKKTSLECYFYTRKL
jgi:hypothetical protein